jgi:hypothetical protein
MTKARLPLAALGLMTTSVLAQTIVTGPSPTLLAGETRAFQVRMPIRPLAPPDAIEAGPDGLTPREDWVWQTLEGGIGTLDAVAGIYSAPVVDEPRIVKIRATHRRAPNLSAEASLLILPSDPFRTVNQVLGRNWVQAISSELPFFNPAMGAWNRRGVQTQTWNDWPCQRFGAYGLPLTLAWTPQWPAQHQRLTYQEGHELVQVNVSGQSSHVITPRDDVESFTVEALERVSDRNDTWRSHIQHHAISLQGVFPNAGNPVAAPGHQDGQGLSARFRAPFGLALVPPGCDPTGCLVTDPESHVIRIVSLEGEASTPWGRPGEPGHRDTTPSFFRPDAPVRALFNGPTFLCPSPFRDRSWLPGTWTCLVSDSGNHVIRILKSDQKTVTTLAGIPGVAGHRDAEQGNLALFNDPQGLVEDRDGHLYVADRGNRVIRQISPWGWVRTLAGSPGETGSVDGAGAAARFTDLKGLELDPGWFGEPGLLVADGHAIRRVTFAGVVTTVLGDVATPGFQEIAGDAPDPRQALLQPCLKDPCGIRCGELGLEVADRGNNAVRLWQVGQGRLATVVGDPRLDGTRWGLAHGRVNMVLDDPRYGALESPRTLAAITPYRGSPTHYVATGRCLAKVRLGNRHVDRLSPVFAECPPAQVDQAYVLGFSLSAIDNQTGEPSIRTIDYAVDFLEADGTLAAQQRGTGTTANPMSVHGRFSQRGEATVVIRYLTDQGQADRTQRKIRVD